MIFSDAWTDGLSAKQQNLILEYVLNECDLTKELAERVGYTYSYAKTFINSEKGRRAQRMYVEFQIDTERDTLKLKAIKQQIQVAFYNPADILNINGGFRDNIKDLRELGSLAYCIAGIESKIVGVTKEGEPIIEKKIKLRDPEKALAFITKAFKFFEPEEIEDITGEKSIYSMSDEERESEFKRLLKIGGKEMIVLIEEAIGKKLIEEKVKDE